MTRTMVKIAVLAALASVLGGMPRTSAAFDPQPEPPLLLAQAAKLRAAGKFAACQTKVRADRSLCLKCFDPQPEPPKPPTQFLLDACKAKLDAAIAKANAKCSASLDAAVCQQGDAELAPLMEDAGLQAVAHVSQTFNGFSYPTDVGDVVFDYFTGLMWEKKTTEVGSGADLANPHDVDNLYTWSATGGSSVPDGTVFTEFLARLNGSSTNGMTVDGCFAGFCDWRLPTVAELQTMLLEPYPCSTVPCLNPVFGPTGNSPPSAPYWTSTPKTDEVAQVWYVDFRIGAGFTHGAVTHAPLYARAVRGGFPYAY